MKIKDKLEQILEQADGLISKPQMEEYSKEIGHYADTITRELRRLSADPSSPIQKTRIPLPDGKRSKLYYYHKYNIKQLRDLERLGIVEPIEDFYDEAESHRVDSLEEDAASNTRQEEKLF